MADKKQNPLIGAFRDPAPGVPPDTPAAGGKKTAEPVQSVIDPKLSSVSTQTKLSEPFKKEETPTKTTDTKLPDKAAEDKKPVGGTKAAAAPKVTDPTPPDKAGEGKKPAGDTKAAAAPKVTDPTPPDKAGEGKKPAEKPKATTDPEAAPAAGKSAEGKGESPAKTPQEADNNKSPNGNKDKEPKDPKGQAEDAKKDEASKSPDGTQHRFIPLSKIHDLPGTYVKDQPRADYGDMIQSIKAEGLKEPVILRRGEDGEYQLVDGFHRTQAVKKAGMLEIKADVYEMTLKEASDYRRARHTDKPLPIPGKLIPPGEPAKAAQATTPVQEADKDKTDETEIPEDFKLPITREGQSEIITTLKITEIHPFKDHPFHVKDDKDMTDLVDSIKKFGVLEPVVVIPRKDGGFEMISGHRRRRACELAGIATMPAIVRQLDRDEAVISMVDANLKRENISPMEKARAYAMKLEAMKHKAGRRTKEETAALEAAGKKPMRADEELAQQTGESRSNIQKLVRLNNLTPELQQMVEDKTLPVHTAADLSYLKKEEQAAVADAIQKEDKVPTGAQAVELKKASQEGKLTKEKIEQAVAPTKREETPPLKITLGEEDLRPYFPDKRTTIPDVKRGVLEALDLRKKALDRQKAKAQVDKTPKKKATPER